MRKLYSALVAALTSCVCASAASANTFPLCVTGLKQAAVRSGVNAALAAKALGITTPDEKVLRLSQVQPEFDIPIWDYLAFLVDEQRVRDGRAMMQRHAAVLQAVER